VSETPIHRPLGKTLLAAWRLLCYKLTYHRFLSISLKNWLWVWVVVPPLAAVVGKLAWAWAVLISLVAAAALAGAESARRGHYVLFTAAEPRAGAGDPSALDSAPPDPAVLQVDEPLLCWASGRLGVEGKARALAGERASISFVRTREHVVMAQVRRTRFLLFAPVSKADVGYWYAFFHPGHVHLVRPGILYCGFTARPALELHFAGEEAGQSVQLYLAFEDDGAQQRVLADLQRDVHREAF
jgi:hypothetical protein